MHEMSLAEGILGIIEEATAARSVSRVLRVRIEVGALAGVEISALQFSFESVVAGSIAEGAQLEIVAAPGTGWCLDCAQTVPIQALYDPCPRCHGYHVQANGGRELQVLDLEVA